MGDEQTVEQGFAMKIVAQRTGLSPHVIRSWERRYGTVLPGRSDTGRRLYSEAEIERLKLLQQAVGAGHSIGQIAHLPTERLSLLVQHDQARQLEMQGLRRHRKEPQAPESDDSYLEVCLVAAKRLDSAALSDALGRSAVALGYPAVMNRVLVPLAQELGEQWRQGALRIAHEHLASATLRAFLTTMMHRASVDEAAPCIIVTTPAGQVHEIGALLVAVTAAWEGWRVTYLGSNLPAEEIAAAARQNGARAVALSLVYPLDDQRLRDELRMLRSHLAEDVEVLVGGRAVEAYRPALEAVGAVLLPDLDHLHEELERLRSAVIDQAGLQ
jgi:methanogenic corrinoid protein MtbC1/DNA-binding transcriptional MerR regulator